MLDAKRLKSQLEAFSPATLRPSERQLAHDAVVCAGKVLDEWATNSGTFIVWSLLVCIRTVQINND